MIPSANQQRFQMRSSDEINVKRLSNSPNVKPPREVSLRIKFIRLGEVSCHFFKSLSCIFFSLLKKGYYFTREILCRSCY